MDIFAKIKKDRGPIGKYQDQAHEYFAFPKLEGEIGNRMKFNGKERIVWSLNNYLGLANHPEIRKADADAAAQYGMALPMGARMMSGNSDNHDQLENEFAAFIGKEGAMLLNFGYQGMVSAIDAIVSRHDVIVYDAESHACILDGLRLHPGMRYKFNHNDVADCEKQLQRAAKFIEGTPGGILVITEGVFGMNGNQGKIKEIAALKAQYEFRLFVDDAHGFGTMGKKGAGIGEEQDCIEEIDLYFSTFAKSLAGVGGFIAADKDILHFLRYNMRSQIFAKSLPMTMVVGGLKRMELIRNKPELREKLWENVNKLQKGLTERGFNIGTTNTPVTPVYMEGELNPALQMIVDLRENYNIFCSVVVYPVIPKGQIILRLIPTATHTDADINETLEAFSIVRERLTNGEYPDVFPDIKDLIAKK
ncbi:8-amino-7-oxononanoate synthase [Taibaiella sp. KBW10]|uniref:aminotransferase class I/II-fold pyridoxal phosphate-dependent enzyme n=1 Tax=Taibaiella sp. KBW10 TaxID=2153357 RepID=UPI000F5AF0F8|nr:pyridoxal phosphate-dependent aminotransferase family protein [Taibaiella sp. KBW10]RQO30311.1 8-amino-7-oxononanoate synthase [Taibaiella sp. KBW10]